MLAVTTVARLNIGGSGASVTLDCGHVVEMEYRPQLPRPGTPYVCPTCLSGQFSPVELARLDFWLWLWDTGRAVL